MYKLYVKYKWILCLDLGSIPKIPYFMHLTIPKEKEKNPKSEILLIPSIFG